MAECSFLIDGILVGGFASKYAAMKTMVKIGEVRDVGSGTYVISTGHGIHVVQMVQYRESLSVDEFLKRFKKG